MSTSPLSRVKADSIDIQVSLRNGQDQIWHVPQSIYLGRGAQDSEVAPSSLNSGTERCVMKRVRAVRDEKTPVMVAHRLSTIEYCDRLFRFEQKRMVQEGKTAAVLAEDTKKLANQ